MRDYIGKEEFDNMTNFDIENDDMQQDWLKEMIEKDFERFTLPESLKSENLMHLLDDIDIESEDNKTENDAVAASPKKGKVIWLKFASAAACLAVVAFGWNIYSDNMTYNKTALAKAQAPMAAPAAAAPAASSAAVAAEEAYDIVNDAEPAEAAPEAVETEMTMTDSAVAAYDEMYANIEYPEQPSAESYQQLFDIIEELRGRVQTKAAAGMIMMTSPSAVRNEAVMEDAVAAAPMLANPATSGGGVDVYQTNTQVQGVDESDIVKTDGRYIYHYRFDSESGGAQIAIFGANNLQLLSTIKLPDYSDAEMYVSGSRLIVVQQVDSDLANELSDSEQLQKPISEYLNGQTEVQDIIIPDYIKDNNYREIYTEAVVYDISDHRIPKELTRYRQSGNYVSSRLLNGKLYFISEKHANGGGDAMPIIRYIPSAGANDGIMPLSAENILLPPYVENSSYAVVTTMDISDGKADTKAVLGMIDEIMMSKRSLFLAATVYGENRNYRERSTGISRFDVTEDGLKYLSSGKVEGYIDDQFSLDEHNGMLRVATTSYNSQNKTVNNLFVLNEKLEKIGEVTGLAEDERIYSVRFMGDTAYVVTFKETDPLFVIDLSDPKKPIVKGELKIPGFSEYLHPIDNNTLIGLGKNTYVNQYGGVVEDGLKLSLFDVSDPTDPKESANYLIGNVGSHSEALDNHKAFMYYPKKNIIGFPATIYTSYGASIERPWSGESRLSFGGYLVVEVKNGKFNVIGTIADNGNDSRSGFMRNDFGESIERGIYIGNTLYTFAQNKIMAFSLDSFEQIGEYSY